MADKLLKFRKKLIDSCNKTHVDGLLDDLRHENVLTDSEVESIREANSRTREKIRELCDIVRKKGDRACEVLLQKLCEMDETLCTNLGITGDLDKPQSPKEYREKPQSSKGHVEKPKRSQGEMHSEEEHDRQPNKKAKADCAPPTRPQMLLQTLKRMRREQFIEFKETLKDEEFLERSGYMPMTTADLEGKDQVTVTDLLIRRYTRDKALHVASLVLDAIGDKELAKQLRSFLILS